MSFGIICPNCGSPSSPSVGVCPFCKTVLAQSTHAANSQNATVSNVYASGNLPFALSLAKKVYDGEPQARKNPEFLLLYAKILLESEAPSSQVQGILGEAFLLAPNNQDVLDYMELLKLRYGLKQGIGDASEVLLRNLVRRSPNNVHALFILGTHMFWEDGQAVAAIPFLENCVRLSPNFLRAWGCLGAIYKKIGNGPLAEKAFRKCMDLESDPSMKEFFKSQLAGL